MQFRRVGYVNKLADQNTRSYDFKKNIIILWHFIERYYVLTYAPENIALLQRLPKGIIYE